MLSKMHNKTWANYWKDYIQKKKKTQQSQLKVISWAQSLAPSFPATMAKGKQII